MKPPRRLRRAFLPLFAISVVLLAFGAPAARAAFSATGFSPAAGATNVCADTPLRLTFATPPTLGQGGKIQILDAATHTVVETIDLGSPTATQDIGGVPGYKYRPVVISGNEVVIRPKNGALAYKKTYYVTIDAGVFKDGAESLAALDQPAGWRFTTKAAAPIRSAKLTVAADGTGDFCTVQGALDFIPEGNTTPVTLFLRKGTYAEIICLTNKHTITLLGEDRRQTIIACANNAALNPDLGGNPFGGATPDPSTADPKKGPIYRRGMILAHRVNDLTIANLTLRNATPLGGSQAETVIINGTTTARAIFKDVDFYSFQDTIQINGQAYLSNCHIEGDVDFMWGTGPCFFENCTARSLRSGAYYTQIRNPGTNHGFVYLHCTFEGAPGVANNYLSRIQPSRFPHSEVVLLDCVLTDAVAPTAWQLQSAPNPAANTAPANPAGNVHFWEFNSHTPAGQPDDVSKRFAASRQLKQPDDAALIANYRNPTFVLGSDWNPKLAPIFK